MSPPHDPRLDPVALRKLLDEEVPLSSEEIDKIVREWCNEHRQAPA